MRNHHDNNKQWTRMTGNIPIMIFCLVSLSLFLPVSVSGNIFGTEKMILRVPKPNQSVKPWWIIDPNNPQSISGFLPAIYQELQNFENVTFEYVSVGDELIKNMSNVTARLLKEKIRWF